MRRIWAAGAALAMAGGMAAPAPAAWQEASSRHFVVYSDDAPDKVSAFATMLERFDKAMRVMRAMADPPFSPTQRVTVFVIKDVPTLQRLLGDRSAAGVYMPRISGPVAFVPRTTGDTGKLALTPQAVLLHEYAHHFMFSSWGDKPFPAWFVEGFAEFNATMVFQPEQLVIGAPPLYRAYGLVNDDVLPMRELLTLAPQDRKVDDLKRQVFYGRSWMLTHYMLLNNERRPKLAAYLDALEKGTDPKAAAPLLGDPRALDRALNAYSRQRLPLLGLKTADLPIGAVTVRALTPGEEAIMPVVLRSKRGVSAKTAPGVAEAARKIAAGWPDDPAVQVALAEAEFDAGQFEAADAAAGRALAAAPTLRGALLYRGMAQTVMARRDHVIDPARWAAIRKPLLKANHLDPEDPWPLVANYHAMQASGAPMTPNTEGGLSYAFTLAPFDGGLAMQVAALHVRRKEWREAIPALRRVAYDPHGGRMTKVAAGVLTVIESGNTAALDTLATTLEGSAKPEEVGE